MGSTVLPLDLLERIAHLIDAASHDPTDHIAASVELDEGELVLGVRTFDLHPTLALAGLVAPPSWWGLIVCSPGRAHFLDQPDRPPEPIVSTYARSRDGAEVSLLRRGTDVTRLPGPAEGRIPELVQGILDARRP